MPLSEAKKKIRFITNPVSGNKPKSNLKQTIDVHLNHDLFDYEITYTEYPKHGKLLSQKAKESGYYAVIAVGGDGTINEVAAALTHSRTALGIIPFGSGNGFSYHIGIKRDIVKAICIINQCHVETIDTGNANGQFFINVAGMGLDATVAYKTKLNTKRGFFPYFINTFKESFHFKFMKLRIETENKQWENEYGMAVIANGSIYGYDFAVAPGAILNDGLFDVILVKKAPLFKYFFLVFRMLNKTFHKSQLVEYFKIDKITIQNLSKGFFHVDGEGFEGEESIKFEIQPSSLLIIKNPD